MKDDESAISILLVQPRGHSCPLVLNLFFETMPGHYELDIAPSYASALSMMQHRSYDICFAPSRIGKRDVIDLLSEMSGNNGKIPVMIVTAGADSTIGDADITGQKGVYYLIKHLFGGSFLEEHIRSFALGRNRVELEATRANKEWELVFETVPDSIAIVDRNFKFQRVNRAMADRVGVKPADLIGRPYYEVVHGLASPPDFCPMSLMLKDGQEHIAGIFMKNLGGFFLVSVSPFMDDQNNLIGGIHVARDITQLKKIEDELRQANGNLEQHVTMLTSELAKKTQDLEETNITLRVLLKHNEQERKEIQDSVTQNIRELILPILDRMENNTLSREEFDACIFETRSIVESAVPPLTRFLREEGLSPAEIRIAKMIRDGKSNKEIANSLSISTETVRSHRERIRKKLGLINQKTNLKAHLKSIL